MDLREELGTYEILAIALVTIGAIMILAGYTTQYIIWNYYTHVLATEMSGLIGILLLSGFFVSGLGLFLSFRKIYQKLELPQLFSIINYAYLILLLPQLTILFLAFFFFGGSHGFYPSLFLTFRNITFHILPELRKILLAIMFILVFIAIVKGELEQESDSTLKSQTEEPL